MQHKKTNIYYTHEVIAINMYFVDLEKTFKFCPFIVLWEMIWDSGL